VDFSCFGYHPYLESRLTIQEMWALAQTERHIAEGEEHLAQQVLLIEKLERHGHDSEDARALLKTMTETQALHKQDRDRVLKLLFAPHS
jgi:hypothetical protein